MNNNTHTPTPSRGIRNNNPLNIRRTREVWQGASAKQTDPAFVQFDTTAHGYRAAWKLLDNYCLRFIRERRPFTLRNIIARWAPPAENDTESYIRTVVSLSKLGGNESIPRPYSAHHLDKTARLIAAMTCVENGIPLEQVDTAAIWHGYDLAFPGRRRKYAYAVSKATRDFSHWDEYWDW